MSGYMDMIEHCIGNHTLILKTYLYNKLCVKINSKYELSQFCAQL